MTCARLPVVVVTGTSSNFADVRDIARGHLLAAERGRRGETYLLGSRDVPLPELARMMMSVMGRRAPVVVAPFAAARWAARGARFLADHVTHEAPLITPEAVAIAELGLEADCSKAVRELGLPQSPIEIALGDALKWFRQEGYIH
jgi:dihydroflavonol-4-reductase